jgi:hypothetical protein
MTVWLGRIPDVGEPGFWALPTTSGDVAQLGERLVCNQEVGGSIPLVSTNLLSNRDLQELTLPALALRVEQQ